MLSLQMSNNENNINDVADKESKNCSPIDNTPLTRQYDELEQVNILRNEKVRLKNVLEEKTDHLRKLNLVKMYREKSDLNKLDELTCKWRLAAQQAAEVLYNKLNEPRPEMKEFLKQLHIDQKLIHYDEETECFY